MCGEESNRVRARLTPANAKLARAYANHLGQSVNKFVGDAIREKINSIPEQERQRILNNRK